MEDLVHQTMESMQPSKEEEQQAQAKRRKRMTLEDFFSDLRMRNFNSRTLEEADHFFPRVLSPDDK